MNKESFFFFSRLFSFCSCRPPKTTTTTTTNKQQTNKQTKNPEEEEEQQQEKRKKVRPKEQLTTKETGEMSEDRVGTHGKSEA